MKKLGLVQEEQFDLAMALINEAKAHLKAQGIDQWQNGYPDEMCIHQDIQNQKGYFFMEDEEVIGYLVIDYDGETSYEDLKGEWHTEKPYVVVHRMAFTSDLRGKGFSTAAFDLVAEKARQDGIHSFRVDTDNDNQKMKHVLEKNGFTYCGTIWFDNSEKIAFDKVI